MIMYYELPIAYLYYNNHNISQYKWDSTQSLILKLKQEKQKCDCEQVFQIL